VDVARKAVFLDVDGTFVNDRGLVPPSAREAVVAARANGHKLFLCTGRSTAELWDEIVEPGFDGVIAAAGGYVEYEGELLLHRTVPVEDVRHAVEFFDRHGGEYFLESNSGLYGSRHAKERLRELLFGGVTDEDILAELEKGLGGFIDSLVIEPDTVRDDINKISFLDSALTIDQVRAEFEGVFNVIHATVPMFGPNSGEMSIPGIHKATAIELLIEHAGIPRADTIAYGDGVNDVEMLQYVEVGVAMDNAHPTLRAVADRVTADADHDGITLSFAELGLI
jgi:Cof subfamily protein (haloacid dehalogenase superfamily)